MSATFEHSSYAAGTSPQPSHQPAIAPSIESIPDARIAALATAERSCCCIARPAVIAFMKTGPGQKTQAELLLCMHHYRASQQKLAACGATVVDARGEQLTDVDQW
jgi:hypothetical protein